MIYFDNAATSRFKPKKAIKALVYDTVHSANSGRSGHDDAIYAMVNNEKTRRLLLKIYGAESGYNVVFTKNCTEAINLAVFGCLDPSKKIVTTVNDHNAMLRPLFNLKSKGASLSVVNPSDNLSINPKHVLRLSYDADFIGMNLASNVTGAVSDVEEVGKKKSDKTILLVDGAQGSPFYQIDMTKYNIDMLAMPAHKSLHGIQGVGFLIFKDTLKLSPLVYGGTGTSSDSVYQPLYAPEGFEAGTQFSAGIHALYEGAKWSMENLERSRKNVLKLSQKLMYALGSLGLINYSVNPQLGIFSFKDSDIPPTVMADELNTLGFATRSGLHCAPLIHNYLGTLESGLVRVSIGADNTEKEINALISALEKIMIKKKEILNGWSFKKL